MQFEPRRLKRELQQYRVNWTRFAYFLGIVLLCLPILGAGQGIRSFVNVQPQLVALAAQAPTTQVRVIVQKMATTAAVEEEVHQLGGQVINDLPIINALTAQLSAAAAVQLAQSQSVRWLSLDAPVVRSSDEPEALPFKVLLPLIVQDNTGGQTVLDPENGQAVMAAAGNSTPQNYYLDTTNVRSVWNMGRKGNGITVAVVDSGVTSEKDFSVNITNGSGSRISRQISLSTNSSTPNDTYGHGTHVSGIVGGNGYNSGGLYVGVAPEVNLISLKISDDSGMAYESDTVAALQWIYDNKATFNIRVVNLSINSTVEQSYNTSALDAAVEILWFNGVVVVVSAGNKGAGGNYNTANAAPANDPFVITVGATDEKGTTKLSDDVVAPFSAYGITSNGFTKPEIVAPGANIISVLSKLSPWGTLYPTRVVSTNYFRLSGTSMSAPMVAGAVALLLQDEPNLTPDQVKYRLIATSRSVSASSADPIRSYPYLNVYAAVTGTTTQSANTGIAASQMLWSGTEPVVWGSVNWNSVNWNSVNWNSVNWNSVNWNSVNWNSVYW